MLNKSVFFLFNFIFSCVIFSNAQVLTKEDSLNAGLTPKSNPTVISGYGQAQVTYDMRMKTGVANLTRNVVFIGHRFSDKISLFSELELENAKVAAGAPSGEISLEQLFLKFNINTNNYIVAGLFIPRIGIINENHLPTTFNTNERPFVEQLVIPSTWRELGAGVYGQINAIPGLNYSVAILNGLNSAGFTQGSGLRDGRFEGNMATASNLAVSGALLYYVNYFRIQASSYFGGTAGLNQREADSLQLNYGAFGTPVMLNEGNIQYNHPKGIHAKVLATMINISDAEKINRAYANNTPEQMFGFYAELGYDVFKLLNQTKQRSLLLFARYEQMDLNALVPSNGISDDFQKKQFLIGGIHFQPLKGVSIKLDYTQRITGDYNPQLYITNPYSTVLPFYKTNQFVSLGIGYSF
jgi:hypothetical protein